VSRMPVLRDIARALFRHNKWMAANGGKPHDKWGRFPTVVVYR